MMDKEIKGISFELAVYKKGVLESESSLGTISWSEFGQISLKNCKYHDKANNCMAGHINVGNSSATSATDTKCETFECNDGCGCR